MNNVAKKVTRRLTDEEKTGINQMLLNKKTHKEIMEKYNVSSSTVSNIVKKMAGKSRKSVEYKDSKNVAALKASLIAVRNRKLLVEEMLTGSLKQELEQLAIAEENLEKTIDSIIQLEAYSQNA
jgi:IS30 family transposase